MVVRPATGGMKRHVELLMAGLIEREHKLGLVGPEDLAIEPSVTAGSWTRFTSPGASQHPFALIKVAKRVSPITGPVEFAQILLILALVANYGFMMVFSAGLLISCLVFVLTYSRVHLADLATNLSLFASAVVRVEPTV